MICINTNYKEWFYEDVILWYMLAIDISIYIETLPGAVLEYHNIDGLRDRIGHFKLYLACVLLLESMVNKKDCTVKIIE